MVNIFRYKFKIIQYKKKQIFTHEDVRDYIMNDLYMESNKIPGLLFGGLGVLIEFQIINRYIYTTWTGQVVPNSGLKMKIVHGILPQGSFFPSHSDPYSRRDAYGRGYGIMEQWRILSQYNNSPLGLIYNSLSFQEHAGLMF